MCSKEVMDGIGGNSSSSLKRAFGEVGGVEKTSSLRLMLGRIGGVDLDG